MRFRLARLLGPGWRLLVVAVVLSSGASEGRPAGIINEAEHKNLPVFQKSITFLSYRPVNRQSGDFHVMASPGQWSDVCVIDWQTPVATISGYGLGGRSFGTARVHLTSFPANLRPLVPESAAKTKSLLTESQDRDSLLLRDGTVLKKYVIVQTTPEDAIVEHEGGRSVVPLSNFTPAFLKDPRLFGKFLYRKELALPEGETLQKVRISARNPEEVRISHESGTTTLRLDQLAEDVRAVIRQALIIPGIFSDEIVTDPALSKDRTVRRPPVKPRSEQAEPPKPPPVLERSAFGVYATLPTSDGTVLRDARIIGLSETRAEFSSRGETRSVSLADLPEEVRMELGIPLLPMFREVLGHGLVARKRSPIFELGGRDAGREDILEAAKTAVGGRTVARVGTGYLLMEARTKTYDGGTVLFPKPLANLARGFVESADFAHLGNHSWRAWWLGGGADPLADSFDDEHNWTVFEPVDVAADTVLLDPFEGKHTLFGNREGAIKRAWRLRPVKRAGLAIVETKAGFYLGVLAQQQELPESRMTWEQLAAQRSGGFTMEKTGQKNISPNSVLFQVNGAGWNPERKFFSSELARILPTHYRTLTDKGVDGLLAQLETSQMEGVETLPDTANESYTSIKELEVERIGIQFRSMAAGTVVLNIVIQQNERMIERKASDGNLTALNKTPWKSRKVEKLVELDRDADGGIRLTDGKIIYELTFPKVGGYLLATYEVKANPLNRAPR